MAAHKKRSGAPMVSYSCKIGEHGAACDRFVAEMGDVIVCHCTEPGCHAPCERPACLAPRVQRRAPRRDCPTCFVRLPLSGECDDHGAPAA